MQNPDLAHPEWEPEFVDYLYLSFTNATAVSPTDVMPLSRWAKLTMPVQSLVSLATVALAIARAVSDGVDRLDLESGFGGRYGNATAAGPRTGPEIGCCPRSAPVLTRRGIGLG
jgi:hypothetical protein